MIYPYINDELYIISLWTNKSYEKNPECPKCGNDTTDYITIMEMSLFDRIPKCYIDYFNTFGFIVGNLVVTYHSMEYKRDPNKDDK
jgi:hypothetical protein